jgi:trimeric autotransporter adhesin
MNAFVNRLAKPLPWLALVTLLVVNSCSNEHLVSIAVTPANATVTQTGDTTQFQAVGTTNHTAVPPSNLTSGVSWSSSATSVATITSTGLATTVGCGTTTITAQDGSLSGDTQFTNTCGGAGGAGNPILESINLYPSSPTIPQIGQTNQFIALGVYAPATTSNDLSSIATWASSDVSIATVSSTGLATAVSCGTTTITAQYLGVLSQTQLTISCTVVQTPVLQAINLFPTSPTIQLAQSTQFIALGVYSPAGSNNVLTTVATWASSNSGVATVGSSTGLATAVSCGTTTITAGYQGVIGQTLLTVPCTGNQTLQSIAVLPGNPTIPQIGQTTQFLALGTLLGGAQEDLTTSATWSSSNTQVVTVGANSGTATSVNCGTSTISAAFTPSGGTPIVGTTLLTVSCNSITSIELLVVKLGNNAGTVTSVPTGINCGTVCGGLFDEGTGFILTAPGGTWATGSCDQTINGACYFTLVPDSPGGTSKTVTVTF